jgi:hypothetical protein
MVTVYPFSSILGKSFAPQVKGESCESELQHSTEGFHPISVSSREPVLTENRQDEALTLSALDDRSEVCQNTALIPQYP